ncbi:hypothetical protein CDAR_396221 [Caerostris darwini]|uniref:Uncharacterized protein n=1 Tax=Caerostris darwini TaxID=1538125 RepID=A0AAV4WQW0_9ARAC|nr:hypothetical protein CDAR_396221 [Caerostris darwini]
MTMREGKTMTLRVCVKRKVWEEGESIEASGRLSMVIEKEHKKAAVLRRNPETSKGFCSMKEPADGKPPKCSIRQGTV